MVALEVGSFVDTAEGSVVVTPFEPDGFDVVPTASDFSPEDSSRFGEAEVVTVWFYRRYIIGESD